MGQLEGKVAIVTGAGGGIGSGIALAFAKEGAKVAAVGRSESIAVVVENIRTAGGTAIALRCDVGVEEQAKSTVERTAKELGPVEILVNVAQGFGLPGQPHHSGPLEDFPEETWDAIFQSGVKATFYFCKAVFPFMKERGGKIINFGAASGMTGLENIVAYNANKEAIRAVTRTAAREWGKYKINVNVICPAALTPTLEQALKDHPEKFDHVIKSIPLGRLGAPEDDLGRAAVFLASKDSDFITGQTICVDGGLYMFP